MTVLIGFLPGLSSLTTTFRSRYRPAPTITNPVSTSQVVYSASSSDDTMMNANNGLLTSELSPKDILILHPSYYYDCVCLFWCLIAFKLLYYFVNIPGGLFPRILPFPMIHKLYPPVMYCGVRPRQL